MTTEDPAITKEQETEADALSEDTDDEAIVEEILEESEVKEEKQVKMKDVIVDEWVHLNPLAPIWARWGHFLEKLRCPDSS